MDRCSSIIDYLVYAKDFINQCEERYGLDAVEELLDSCHALSNFGVDRYRRPPRKAWARAPGAMRSVKPTRSSRSTNSGVPYPAAPARKRCRPKTVFPRSPRKISCTSSKSTRRCWSPGSAKWCVVRKIAQYFYPQRQTQVMNEGWATFWHYTLLNTLYDEGYLSDGMMLEWMGSHTNVIFQPPVGHRAYNGINPYALGFGLYRDIQRICQNPTEEDRQWFPDLAGTPWLPALDHAMRNFKDESFIGQYLSPHLMREMRLFAIHDDAAQSDLLVTPFTTRTAIVPCARLCRSNTTWVRAKPNIQV